MDESTLRNYFRKVLGVAPGASRKELRNCRDKRAQRWRADIVAPHLDAFPQPQAGQAAADTAEGRLAITNTAYDCLSNADKFRDFQSRLAAGEVFLPDLELLSLALGEAAVKAPPPRVLAKRQAQLQEKLERTVTLASESVKKAGHDEALKLTQGKLPDADVFYEQVYKAAVEAGKHTCEEEIAGLGKAGIELDETFKGDIDSVIIDQAEIIAHKEYDRLEDRAARSAPTPAKPKIVALMLSLIIMAMVFGACLWGATTPPTVGPASQTPFVVSAGASTAPQVNTAPGANVMPAAPAAGIANSVFNKSVFGAANNQATTATTNQVVAPAAPVNSGAAPAPASVANAVQLSEAEINSAEVAPADNGAAAPPSDLVSYPIVGAAGTAGLAGYATGTRAGGNLYASALEAAMKGLYNQSQRDFYEAYVAGHAKEALYNQAVALTLQGEYVKAVEVYDQVLALKPLLPQALYNRALSHQLMAQQAWTKKNSAEWRKQLNLAASNYNLAVKVDPRMSQAYYNRGLVYHDLGQLEKSSADFSKASQLPVFMQAAAYNRDVIDLALKKRSNPPTTPAPPAPVGPVGPAGPA